MCLIGHVGGATHCLLTSERGVSRFALRETAAYLSSPECRSRVVTGRHEFLGYAVHVIAPPVASPTVTVVVPTYRRPQLLQRAVESVKGQTWSDWELLIVDDNGIGSAAQQETAALLRSFVTDYRIRYHVHERNLGACAARNTGIRQARGQYVAFLDDDDTWYPDKLEHQVRCFERERSDIALVYGGFRRVLEDGRTTVVTPDGTAHVPPRLLMENAIGTTSVVMCRRSALLDVDGFDERLPAMQDFDLYVRLGLRFPFAWTDHLLVDHYRHPGPRISTEQASTVRAHELFYLKHRNLFARNPQVHHHRLRAFALEMMRAGRFAESRSLYWRAWCARPNQLRTLALAFLARPTLLGVFRRVKQVWLHRSPREANPLEQQV